MLASSLEPPSKAEFLNDTHEKPSRDYLERTIYFDVALFMRAAANKYDKTGIADK
jgi:hypothetical protein